jgi:DNA-binding GntR family transcriptional regulator
MRELYLEKNPTQVEQTLNIHSRLIKAIQERNSYEAILVVEEHFNLLIEQLYNISGEQSH